MLEQSGRRKVGWTDVGVQAEGLAQGEETLLRSDLADSPLRPSNRPWRRMKKACQLARLEEKRALNATKGELTHEDGVGRGAGVERRLRQRLAVVVDSDAAEVVLGEVELEFRLSRERLQHAHSLTDDLRTCKSAREGAGSAMTVRSARMKELTDAVSRQDDDVEDGGRRRHG